MTVKDQNRNPQGTRSFGYAMSINHHPGGSTDTVEVTPYTGRSTGTSANAKAQRASISRQLG